jgi:hypothetical protein
MARARATVRAAPRDHRDAVSAPERLLPGRDDGRVQKVIPDLVGKPLNVADLLGRTTVCG